VSEPLHRRPVGGNVGPVAQRVENQDHSTGQGREEDHSMLLRLEGECLKVAVSKDSSGQVDEVCVEYFLGFKNVRIVRRTRVVHQQEDKEQGQEGEEQTVRHLRGIEPNPNLAARAQDISQIRVQVPHKGLVGNLVVNSLHSVGEQYEFGLQLVHLVHVKCALILQCVLEEVPIDLLGILPGMQQKCLELVQVRHLQIGHNVKVDQTQIGVGYWDAKYGRQGGDKINLENKYRCLSP